MAPDKQLTNDDRDFIDRRINEADRRQDIHFKEKIEALEKLLNLTITTKADALAVLINRLQIDNKDCAVRCAKQVQQFSTAIGSLRDKLHKYNIEELTSSVHALEAIKKEKELLEAEKKALTDKVEEFERWRDSFWVKNVLSAVVISTAVVNAALYGFTWLVDYISKIISIKGSGPYP